MVNDDIPQDRAGEEPDGTAPARAAGDVTLILSRIEQGEPHAAEQLLPLVYDELRKLAAAKMAQEKPGQTLQATALVHEAYLRLVDETAPPRWDSRRHFYAAAAEAMRRILVEGARRKARPKHGGDLVRHNLDEVDVSGPLKPEDVLALHEAIERLEAANSSAAEIVKLRFYAGCTIQESAEMLGVSPRRADQIWAYARAWLLAEILGDDKPLGE